MANRIETVDRAAWATYDQVLRSQGVEEGVQSYSRVVELLLGTDVLKIPSPKPAKSQAQAHEDPRPESRSRRNRIPAVIEEAAAAIRDGKLVAFPTETVYGLGAHALDESAVQKIFDAKERPATDPLIVHIAHVGQVAQCAASFPAAARKLALSFWAGPLTLILPKKPSIPDLVTAGLPNVALRAPSHRVARALMEMAGVPIAAPSANRFSRPSPTTAAHVTDDLDGRVDLILDGGATDIGLESTIVDFSVDPPVLRRPGGITFEQVHSLVPEVIVQSGEGDAAEPQAAPGQMTPALRAEGAVDPLRG